MGAILEHAAEYETVRRLAAMLGTAKEDYRATESYALFSTILCWVMQRAGTRDDQAGRGDVQARAFGDALRCDRIDGAPWHIEEFPDMTAFDFFRLVRNSVAHGDGRQIRPWNEGDILVGQIVTIKGRELRLRRRDMQRLGCALAGVFCETMERTEPERELLQFVRNIRDEEDDAA